MPDEDWLCISCARQRERESELKPVVEAKSDSQTSAVAVKVPKPIMIDDFVIPCKHPLAICEDASGCIPMPLRKNFQPSRDYFTSKVTLNLEIMALPTEGTAYLYLMDGRLSKKNANAMCTMRWKFFQSLLSNTRGRAFDAVFRIRDNLVSENKSRQVLLFDIVVSVLCGHRGGVTCFLLPGHSHFYADSVGAAAKKELQNQVAYTSDEILDLIKTSKRVTAIEEVKLILDWSVIVPLFKKLPLNFTKNYYFRWILPEDDGQVVMSMYKFGGYRGENVVLASSVKDLRKTLSPSRSPVWQKWS